MKTKPTYIALALSLPVWLGLDLWATPSTPIIISAMTEEGKDIYEESPKGLRTAAPSVSVAIDFTALSITCSSPSTVISYELWDETDNSFIASYAMDYDMVSFMASLTGCYQLRLVTAESTYIGYIEL